MAKKKKTAKKKAAKKRSHRRSSHGGGDGADLSELLRQYGVDESRISEAVADIRALSDAQAGEGPPPTAPAPAPIDSTAELNVVTAGGNVVSENERIGTQTRPGATDQTSTDLRECQSMLLAIECEVIPGLPRTSFVGRAIHIRTNGRTAGTSCVEIYETINGANDQLLPEPLRRAIRVTRDGSEGETKEERRKRSKAASSALINNLKPRIRFLADRLRYVDAFRGDQSMEYRLTTFAQQLFNGWPAWRQPDAIPTAGAEPAPEEPASGPATQPT
jgi:hypothetical protein